MYSSSAATKRPYFMEGDDGLASLADTKAGFSENQNHPFFSRYNRRSSLRNLSTSVSSPRSARFYDARFEDHQPHFLKSCFLCKKPLGDNKDIFMYRGDTPFCSVECRQEQIDRDEAKEKNWNLSSSMKAIRQRDQKKSTSPNKAQGYPSRAGTIAAA